MIDIEATVFDTVASKINEVDASIRVLDSYQNTLAALPTVTIEEVDNAVYEKMSLAAPRIETHAYIVYEVGIYTEGEMAKIRGREILNLVDSTFSSIGFTRISAAPTKNFLDPSVMRYVARYKAVVSEDGIVYQN